MSKYKNMIREDIKKCDVLINEGKATVMDENCIVAKYIMDYPNFREGMYEHFYENNNEKYNNIDNIKMIKAKLEYLINRIDNPDLYIEKNAKTININSTNNNSISNKIEIDFSIEDIKEKIEENTYLNEDEKEELLKKLKEIEDLQKSKESKSKKWNVAKGLLKFIADKGADIAIMYIPQILKGIQ